MSQLSLGIYQGYVPGPLSIPNFMDGRVSYVSLNGSTCIQPIPILPCPLNHIKITGYASMTLRHQIETF